MTAEDIIFKTKGAETMLGEASALQPIRSSPMSTSPTSSRTATPLNHRMPTPSGPAEMQVDTATAIEQEAAEEIESSI
jgi:hypothetical protein